MAKKKVSAKEIMYPHSKAKLNYYQSYLSRYLPIMRLAEFTDRIFIFDVFCGTGIYEDGTKGSPILAFEAIKRSHYMHVDKPLTPVSLCINDLDSSKIDGVQKYIATKNQKQYCTLGFYNKDASKFLNDIIACLPKQTTKTRNLVLIDPYGYKNIKKEDLGKLLSKGNTEIMLFLPISNIYRFSGNVVSDEDRCVEGLRNFIYSFFPDDNHPVRNTKASCEKDFIEYIRIALNFDDKYYSTSFYLQRDNKGHYFSMFSITPNLKGLEKIVEVKWALNEVTGEGFELPKPQSLFDEQFTQAVKEDQFDKLTKLIVDFIKRNEIVNNNQLYEFTLKNMFLTKHCNDVLKHLQRNKKISVVDVVKNKQARKAAFYLSYKNFKEDNVKVNISLN